MNLILELVFFLAAGTVLMGIPIAFVSHKYEIALWKSLVATILLTISGTAGTCLMYYLENGKFGGLSFYGAVFLVPVVFIVAALLLHVSFGKLMDACAIGECIMLALMKVRCMLGECCKGRVLFVAANGTPVLFPSREVEMFAALVLFFLLLRWALRGVKTGELYAWYLLLYGSTRFVLNIFRQAWVDQNGILPPGNVWSLVAIVIGIVCLLIIRARQKTLTAIVNHCNP